MLVPLLTVIYCDRRAHKVHDGTGERPQYRREYGYRQAFFLLFFCPVQRADENVIMLAYIHYLHTMEFGSGCWYVRGT